MTDTLLVHIGEKIRSARKSQNLSIEELAYNVHTGINYLSQVERGQRNLSVKKLYSIALALGVRPESLLQGSNRHANVRDNTSELVANLLSGLKPRNKKAVLNILKETTAQVGKL